MLKGFLTPPRGTTISHAPAAHELRTPYGYIGPFFDPDPDPEPDPEPIPSSSDSDSVEVLRYRIAQRERENARYRQQNRSLRERVPPEGAVVLTADEARAWAAYQELGAPTELKTRVGELETLRTKVQQAERQQLIASVARAAGFDADVLAQLGADREYEVRKVKDQKGQEVEQALIKDGDVLKPLDEYAAQHWAKFLPSLQVQGAQGGQSGQRAQGARMIEQGSGGRAAPSNPVADRLARMQEQRAAAKNPLKRA